MTLSQLANKYGVHHTYFYTLTKDKKDYIFSFHKDKEKSVEIYVEHIQDIRNKVSDMFYINEYHKDIGLWLREINYLPNAEYDSMRVNRFQNVLYSYTENPMRTNWNTIQKLEYLHRKGVEYGYINSNGLSNYGNGIN